MSPQETVRPPSEEGTAIETLQSLIVAFVLAMTFRGFVTEGFVIPTGSMAPTLLGRHGHLISDQTGADELIGVDRAGRLNLGNRRITNTYLGPDYENHLITDKTKIQMGDRILVLKYLYLLNEPDRFDVVVFKNPTDPVGASQNYIKRLIGLPNEKIWLLDGDVFVAPYDEDDDQDPSDLAAYSIARKPEHVQQAVWQPVYDSDYIPGRPTDIGYDSPWVDRALKWRIDDRRDFRCDTAEPSSLTWSNLAREINDWTPYNYLTYRPHADRLYPVNDLRVAAGVVADVSGLQTTFILGTREHRFEFTLAPTENKGRDYNASIGMFQADDDQKPLVEETAVFKMPAPGRVLNVEFWHVDQAAAIYINDKRVVELIYDWKPSKRLPMSYGLEYDEVTSRLPDIAAASPELRWDFQGSPVTLHRVRVDRDIYYQPTKLNSDNPNIDPADPIVWGEGDVAGIGYGTHPGRPAKLGPDHFFMLGDNSAASLDGRRWGPPADLVAQTIDPAPFVVNRDLLIGKAWLVYFPAPLPIAENARSVVPDFGQLRFIR